jgi:hypothetical protein
VFRTAIGYFFICAFLSVLVGGGALVIWGVLTAKSGTLLSGGPESHNIGPFLTVAAVSPLVIFGLGAAKLYARAASQGVSQGRRIAGSLVFAASPLLTAGLVLLALLLESALAR